MRDNSYTDGFNNGYREGFTASREKTKELELKIADLQKSIDFNDLVNENLRIHIKDLNDEIEHLKNIIKESNEITLTVGFTEMNVKVNHPVTGLFLERGPKIVSGDDTEFIADQELFFGICHKDLSKCKIKGNYKENGVFVITNIEVLKED